LISSSRGLGAWTRALKVRTDSSHSFLCNAESNGEILSLTTTSSSPLWIQELQRLSSQKEMLRMRYAVMSTKKYLAKQTSFPVNYRSLLFFRRWS
jgi:hypothetical protein